MISVFGFNPIENQPYLKSFNRRVLVLLSQRWEIMLNRQKKTLYIATLLYVLRADSI